MNVETQKNQQFLSLNFGDVIVKTENTVNGLNSGVIYNNWGFLAHRFKAVLSEKLKRAQTSEPVKSRVTVQSIWFIWRKSKIFWSVRSKSSLESPDTATTQPCDWSRAILDGNMINIFGHERENFVSGNVLFLMYKHHWNTKPFHISRFLSAKGAIYVVL